METLGTILSLYPLGTQGQSLMATLLSKMRAYARESETNLKALVHTNHSSFKEKVMLPFKKLPTLTAQSSPFPLSPEDLTENTTSNPTSNSNSNNLVQRLARIKRTPLTPLERRRRQIDFISFSVATAAAIGAATALGGVNANHKAIARITNAM